MKKTIKDLILQDTKRSLWISSAIIGLVVTGYSIFSLYRVETSASRFMLTHIIRVCVAEHNSQNVAGIDNRVRQFIETWKATQDIDVRVEVFIENKLVSQVGQLHPFRFFSYNVSEQFTLASGENLMVRAQISPLHFVIIAFFHLVIIELVVFLIFFNLKKRLNSSVRTLTEPLENQIKNVQVITQNLTDKELRTIDRSYEPVLELTTLNESIQNLLDRISHLEDDVKAKGIIEGKAKMTTVLAHNIRGLLSSLKIRIDLIQNVSPEEKESLTNLLSKTLSVAEGVLETNRPKSADFGITTAVDVSSVVMKAVEEVKLKVKGDTDIQYMGNSEGIRALCNQEDLGIIIENLLNNSKEAASSHIKIITEHGPDEIRISIEDNGKGIPKHLLSNVGQEGFTWGKKKGNGVGLYHAALCFTKWGGHLSVESEVNIGTKVVLYIPRLAAHKIENPVFNLKPGMEFVIVDDDELIHQTWKMRLNSMPYLKGAVDVHHIYSPEEFHGWIKTRDLKEYNKRAYLFDYEFKGYKENGLDLIEKYGVNFESILNSGISDTSEVATKAKKIGVRFVRKAEGEININFINEKRKEATL